MNGGACSSAKLSGFKRRRKGEGREALSISVEYSSIIEKVMLGDLQV